MPDSDNLSTSGNPNNYLEGIYNYCDRWCERCNFTGRCAVYYRTEKDFPSGSILENPADFFEYLRKIFEETKNMLDDKLKEFNFDEITPEDLLEAERITKSIEERIETNPLVLEARKYPDLVKYWFESNSEILKQKEMMFNNNLRLGLHGYTINNAQLLNEVFEIIHFYSFFIAVKIIRAFRDKYEMELDGFDTKEDMLTTAKLLLLAITRSIAAWQILIEFFPEMEASTTDIFLLLNRIRIKLEDIFPEAWAYERLYFDRPQ